MPTSGITTTTYNANVIIAAALRKLGINDGGGVFETWEYDNGRQALNMIAWQLRRDYAGFKMWARKRSTLTLSAKNNFVLKTSGGDLNTGIPIEIITATLKDGSNEIQLLPMLIEEYQAIGNKASTGDPSKYYYEKQLDAGYFYIDRVPSDITKTIVITHLRPIEDFNAGEDLPDFPQEWYRPLVLLLRNDLAPEYNKPVTQDMLLSAQQAVAMADAFAPEEEDVYFQPGRDE